MRIVATGAAGATTVARALLQATPSASLCRNTPNEPTTSPRSGYAARRHHGGLRMRAPPVMGRVGHRP